MAPAKQPKKTPKAAPKRKQSRTRSALRAAVKPGDPAGSRLGRHGMLLLPQRQAGVRVTEYTALTLGAFWACVRVISEDLAKLPWGTFRWTDSGARQAVPDHDIEWLLDMQANPETSAYHFRETILQHALVWGNGYAEIERDGAGRPVWLWQITPDRASLHRTQSGRLVYKFVNPNAADTELDAADVFHLRGPGFDGVMGYSVVHLARRSIGLGIALEETAAGASGNDATPGGVLEAPGRLKETAAANLRESWNRVHSGPSGKRRVAVLEDGIKWHQTAMPPEDLQLIEQRQVTPSELCRWFRVPPHKVADLLRATFSNIEELNIEYVGDALSPWARRLESEADLKLFGPINRGTLHTRLDLVELLRGKTAERGNYYNSMLDRGVFSINDVLAMEGRNPIGKVGDRRFVPLNMQPLDQAGQPKPSPEPPAKPTAGDETPKPPEDDSAARLAALRPVFEDACARLLSREGHRVADGLKRLGHDSAQYKLWLEQFTADQETYLRASLSPALDAAVALSGGAPPISAEILARFTVKLRSDFTARGILDEGGRRNLVAHYAAYLLRAVAAACGVTAA